MPADARAQMSEQLRQVGFGAVTMLKTPVEGANLHQPGPRGVAA